MKKTLLIITLFIGLGNVSAQSDATWKETTDFIVGKSNFYYTDYILKEFLINKNELTIKLKQTADADLVIYSLDLSKIGSVNIYSSFIELNLVGPYCTFNCADRSCAEIKKTDLAIFIADEELIQRVFTAFEHLAKLAIEKREGERKTSGDKF